MQNFDDMGEIAYIQSKKNGAQINDIAQYLNSNHGLKHDGTDTVLEIQTALNALASEGYKTIVFPPRSVFNIDAQIVVPSGIDLDFNGSTINVSVGNAYDAIKISASNTKVKNALIKEANYAYTASGASIIIDSIGNIENIELENIVTVGSRGIVIWSDEGFRASNVKIINCSASESAVNGLTIANTDNVVIENCIGFHNKYDGLKLEQNATNIKVIGGSFNSNGLDSALGNGIDTYAGGNKVTIISSTIDSNTGTGLHTLSSSENPTNGIVRDINIVGCTISNNLKAGIDILNVNTPEPLGALPANVHIIACVIRGNHEQGINLNGARYVKISDCDVRENYFEGIQVRNSFYIDICNNSIIKNAQASNTYSGIKISLSDHVKVIGGDVNGSDSDSLTSNDESALTKYHNHGILIEDATNCNNIYIFEPVIKNYLDKPINLVNYNQAGASGKRIVLHYGDVLAFNISTLAGGMGSTLWSAGKLYSKNSSIQTISWREAVKSAEGAQGFTANGSTDAFNIAHGLGATPKRITVSPRNVASTAAYYIYADATNITVKFVSAPASATSLSFNWAADV